MRKAERLRILRVLHTAIDGLMTKAEKKAAVAKGRRGFTRSKVAAVTGAASRSSKAVK